MLYLYEYFPPFPPIGCTRAVPDIIHKGGTKPDLWLGYVGLIPRIL